MSTGTRRRPGWFILAGAVAGLMLVAIAEAVSLAFSSASAPFISVGGAFIDIIPPWVKDMAIELFGTADKLVLFASMLLVYLLLCAAIGWLGRSRRILAAGALGLLGLFATGIVLTRAANSAVDVIPTLVGTAVAVPLLLVLLRTLANAGVGSDEDASSDGSGPEDSPAPSRRKALIGLAAAGAFALVAGSIARGVNSTRQLAGRVAEFVLPTPTDLAPSIPASAQVDLPGMPPYLTPADDFYRIDTALAVPDVDIDSWQLRIHGLVDEEVVLTLDDLLDESMVERHITLTCVSNTVGGDLAGNATWIGVPVRTLLERAGVQSSADMVLSRSVDGFTASTPLEALTDERDSLIAVGMNGGALPPEHGYPVRMVVPGLYGYVSATKWLTELKVTRFADDTAYWTDRGWSDRGPIKIASRVDVPGSFDELTPDDDGSVMVGGTAWAQQRGIDRVEVSFDDGEWQEVELAAEVTIDTWTQWSLRWEDASPGQHRITVRATDGTGEQQTQERADPVPNGASGWHTVTFTVA